MPLLAPTSRPTQESRDAGAADSRCATGHDRHFARKFGTHDNLLPLCSATDVSSDSLVIHRIGGVGNPIKRGNKKRRNRRSFAEDEAPIRSTACIQRGGDRVLDLRRLEGSYRAG